MLGTSHTHSNILYARPIPKVHTENVSALINFFIIDIDEQ